MWAVILERGKEKERETRGVKRGKGLGLKMWGVKERRPVAKLLSLLSQDSKRTICWSLDGQTESSALPLVLRASAFSPSQGNYGAQSQQPRLASEAAILNQTVHTSGFEWACLIMPIMTTIYTQDKSLFLWISFYLCAVIMTEPSSSASKTTTMCFWSLSLLDR